MAYSERGGAWILLCLGLVVVASSFCRGTALSRLKALGKLKENSALSPGQVEESGLRNGRLLIGPNSMQAVKLKGTRTAKKRLRFDTDYQADMVWAEARQAQGQGKGLSMPKQDNSAVERLLGLEPKVECTGDSMKLQIHGSASNPGSLFYVDRGSQYSPLPLSKLPPSCGYTMTSTRRDFVMVAPYDGCFVSLQEENYVLPLRWHGLPVRMSCPLMRPSSPSPPMVTCHCEGMVVRTEWILSVDKIKVNLNGNWEPLMDASSKCGFSVVVHPEGVVISVHYAPCLEKKDGMYTLELTGDGETKISCPVLFETQPKPTGKDPEKQPDMPGKGVNPIPPQTPCPQSAVPEVPSIPQNPEVPYQKPKEPGQPQLPFYPQSPYFFYPYPDTKPLPTAQPSTSPIPKKNDGLQTKQTLPPFIPSQAPNPQSIVPVVPSIPQNPEVPYQKPKWPKEPGQPQLPFYPQSPYFFYPYPGTKPLPTAQPSTSPIPKKIDGLQTKQTLPPFIPSQAPDPQSIVPKVPSIPQNPEVPYQKPMWPKEPGQPQLPFYPQSPYFFYPYPGTKPLPTAQPSTSPIPKTTEGLQIKQTLPPFIPSQAPDPQAIVPKVPSIPQNPEVPYQKPMWPKEPGQPQLPFYPQSPYFFYPYPGTKPLPTAQPSTSPIPKTTEGLQIKQTLPPFIPSQSMVPKVPSIPQNPEVPYQKPMLPKEPGQPPMPFYPQSPYFFYPYPGTKPLPTAQPSTSPIPKTTEGLQTKQTVPPYNLPVAPQRQVPMPFFPYTWPTQPEKVPEHPAKTPATQPPNGKVENPFNPYLYYVKPPYHFPAHKPELNPMSPPAIQIANGQRPPNQETPPPQGKYVPNPFNPPPEGPPSTGPVLQKPSVSQEPERQVYQPFNQLPFWPPVWPQGPFQTRMPPIKENQPAQKPIDKPSYPQSTKTPTESPAPSEQPPHIKLPNGQFYPLNIYYPLQPQPPQPVTPAPSSQPPKQITTAQPKNDTASQSPQSGYPYMPPMLCPQVCPLGISNCCPQIAFHQHLHHFVPPGFGNYLTAPPPQEPSEAATTTQSSTSPQSLTKNEKHPYFLPLDGIHAAPGGVPSETSNTKPIYPYFIPNKHYSYEPQKETLENSPQTQTADQYNTPDGPENPVVPYHIQPTGQQMSQLLPVDRNPPSWNEFLSIIAQYQQQHFANEQSQPSAKKRHQSNVGSIEQTRTKVQSVVDRPLVPYSMLQDDQAPNHSSQSSESGSKKPSHERTIQPQLESQGYILLQGGPPGREPDRLDGDFHHPNLNPPQGNLQRPGWLEKMSNPLPVEYRPRPVDESAIERSHLVPLSSDRSLSEAHFKSEFIESLKDMWKPTTQGSNQRKPMVQQRHFSDGTQQD